jgi:hypothetical protein
MLKFGKQSPFKLEWEYLLRVRVSLFASCFPDSVAPPYLDHYDNIYIKLKMATLAISVI